MSASRSDCSRGGPPPNTTIPAHDRATVTLGTPPGASRRSGRASALRACALAAAVALLAGACAGDPITGNASPHGPTGTGTTGETGGTNAEARFVGRWSRTIYFYDDTGDLNSSQTIWTFAADGNGARTVYARNETWGYEDAVVTLLRWSVAGSEVLVTYQAPDSGSARFSYRFEPSLTGDVLWLGDIRFVRLGP